MIAVKQFSECVVLSLSSLLSRSRLFAKSERSEISRGLFGWRFSRRMAAASGARSLDVPRVLAKDKATLVMLLPMKSIYPRGRISIDSSLLSSSSVVKERAYHTSTTIIAPVRLTV